MTQIIMGKKPCAMMLCKPCSQTKGAVLQIPDRLLGSPGVSDFRSAQAMVL